MNLFISKISFMYEQTHTINLLDKNELNFSKAQKELNLVCLTSYPQRECGIATFSKDLRDSIMDMFGESVNLSICAVVNPGMNMNYDFPVEYILEAANQNSYKNLALALNQNEEVDALVIQHEFGLFGGEYGENVLYLFQDLMIPVYTTFHTVLPNPSAKRKFVVYSISDFSDQIIVMTQSSSKILIDQYEIEKEKIQVIPHGTHLISLKDRDDLKSRYFLKNRKVLSTFGLLNSGKGIETALYALPEIIKENPECMYLIIGKTHPEVVRKEGEKYRELLVRIIDDLKLNNHVMFIDKFVTNDELLEFLQMTDIYLFTSKDPHQAVSGTFSYAMGCNCPIISTQIPHAMDSLENAGIIIDFNDSSQLGQSANYLFRNPEVLNSMRMSALERIKPSAWPNVALSHMNLFNKQGLFDAERIIYKLPEYNLGHIQNLSHFTGVIQFSKAEVPDLDSGFTLDDNARALIALTEYYELTEDLSAISLINTYFNFIEFMQQDGGDFLNYLDKYGFFTLNNFEENLEDSNGRAIWALGYFYSRKNLFHDEYSFRIETIFEKALNSIQSYSSPRAIAFLLKGIYYYNTEKNSSVLHTLLVDLANQLTQFYMQSKVDSWNWFENKLTYGNALLPEALLLAYKVTNREEYLQIAKESFDFLLEILFEKEHFRTISNRTWHEFDGQNSTYGEQPIDVAYTIMAMEQFNSIFPEEQFDKKMKKAFDWYQGDNYLRQIVYNELTGGCCDGIEHDRVNVNQGAESTITYLLARNSIERINRMKTQGSNTQFQTLKSTNYVSNRNQ
jgi:glycosyltransferase involved in cell wall biosynthesis